MENIQRTTGKPFSPAYEKGIHKVALENKNKDYILKDFMGG
ncbi:MAG: hypothetical protein QM532_03100 [Cyanobium sp. MAG06]|nr:hypothetical protein [Cyanobium sp. MAG06]